MSKNAVTYNRHLHDGEFYYQNQNAVSGLYCQAKFSNYLLTPREKTTLNKKSF